MRIAGAALCAVLVACGPAGAAPSAPAGGAGAAAVTAPGARAGGSAKTVTILANEGGVLRSIPNGGRVALSDGFAKVALSPVPIPERAQLDVTVFDAGGRAIPAEVSVTYESMDMDHGRVTEKGIPYRGGYQIPLAFVMPGTWRMVLEVRRGAVEDRVTFVPPGVGF